MRSWRACARSSAAAVQHLAEAGQPGLTLLVTGGRLEASVVGPVRQPAGLDTENAISYHRYALKLVFTVPNVYTEMDNGLVDSSGIRRVIQPYPYVQPSLPKASAGIS